ncbi:phosphatase PAP2 family protein [Rufibacter glacialis]|uniref:Phosphatase PAP2 family protein n=1 Tax=Rufibacter glacialis TaxID=1259555 RepID=A0A5M8Q792_9BACT|nr:phosphatase PAP2 family protein [Rufibacter glacialis]KAA6430690.1 phosphatase PAP2 family protein [Rufibacter glacialis]GGK85838.1 phosphatase PAP2 family protein [Rufibacter glacialis]
MRKHYGLNRFALLLTGASWLLMVLLVWLLPVSFSGYLQHDPDTLFWYALSESGGVYGTPVLGVLLCLLVAKRQAGLKLRVQSFTVAFLFLLATLGSMALLNEYVIKPLAHVPRPSHQFLLGPKGEEASLLDTFYLQDAPSRRAYLAEFLKKEPEKYAQISPLVLEHWVNEAGYSFPSGHSQNAFLLGSLLTMWLGLQVPRRHRPWLALPLVWAVLVCLSRVALGVHSELDVTLGSGVGLLLAYLFSLSGVLRKAFREATHPVNLSS